MIHHLDCGTMCPYLGPLTGGSSWLEPGTMVCHVLVVETARDGLIVVDTGFGSRDCAEPDRLARTFRAIARPRLDHAQTALAQIEAMGFRGSDVRHVVVTHLDVDHAGGLHDFPSAIVHLHAREHAAAMRRGRGFEAERYVPKQWAHGPRWATYEPDGETWMDLPAVRPLAGLHDDVALVPLLGHSRRPSAVAVRDGARWVMHCGDAFYDRNELVDGGRAAPGLRAFAALAQHDRKARHASVATLRELGRAHPEITIVCSHDAVLLEQAQRN